MSEHTTPVQGPEEQPAEQTAQSREQPAEQSTAQRLVGDIAPALAALTDEVLFGQVWARPGLSQRDRSLVTVAALVTNGSTEQLVGHLRRARSNGVSQQELVEAITHLAFYAGWPRAMSAVAVARQVFEEEAAVP